MKKIAIVRRNGLGDLLCAFPLVRYFQKYEPESEITLFLDRSNACLMPYLPSVDRVVVFPKAGYLTAWRVASRFRGVFDLALSAKTSPMKLMNVFLYMLNAKERRAYVDQSWHSRLINAPMQPMEGMHHQALKTLRLVAPEMQEVPEELYPTLHVPAKRPLALPGPIVLVSATTTREASRLSVERYAALLNQLHQEAPISVCIVGQERDAARAQGIAEQLNMPCEVHFPRTFDDFMLCVDAADLYFVGDGGVAHIGAALGKRGVVLFGQSNPVEWHPLSKQVESLYHHIHVDHLEDEAIFEALMRKRIGRREY